jgi:hypothetical protein
VEQAKQSIREGILLTWEERSVCSKRGPVIATVRGFWEADQIDGRFGDWVVDVREGEVGRGVKGSVEGLEVVKERLMILTRCMLQNFKFLIDIAYSRSLFPYDVFFSCSTLSKGLHPQTPKRSKCTLIHEISKV